MAISRNRNRFLMGIERILSKKRVIKAYEIFQFNRSRFMKFFLYNIHSIKWIRINLLMTEEIHAATMFTTFSEKEH